MSYSGTGMGAVQVGRGLVMPKLSIAVPAIKPLSVASTMDTSSQPTVEVTLGPDMLCNMHGGQWDPVTNTCTPGIAQQCTDQGGTWDASTNTCTIKHPLPIWAYPVALGVGAIVLCAVFFGKTTTAKPNRRRARRNASSIGVGPRKGDRFYIEYRHGAYSAILLDRRGRSINMINGDRGTSEDYIRAQAYKYWPGVREVDR